MDPVELQLVIERKDPALPRFVVVPATAIAHLQLTGTTVVEGSLNGVQFGRQTIKPWDADRWFMSVTEALCRKAGVDTGDRVAVSFRVAAEVMPPELEKLLQDDRVARARWQALTEPQRRMLREEVLALKTSTARLRRACQRLNPSHRGGNPG
jgi:hypothetical protein